MVFSWFLDLSIQSWITLVLTKYFSLACIFSLSMSLRMLKVLFGQKEVSFFALKYWLLSLPKKGTFCNRNLNLVVFGQRRSHQNYQGVLNTVFTQRWSLETNIYIIYTLYQPAFAELQNVKRKKVKGWKWFKITTWEKLNEKSAIFCGKSAFPLWYQTIGNPGSSDTDTEKWKLIFGRFDVSAFSWRSPSAFSTIDKGLI